MTKKKHKTCLMAYTLNNRQPVICTIVADKPNYFIQSSDEDDDFLNYSEFEEELSVLKKKMDEYERSQQRVHGLRQPAETTLPSMEMERVDAGRLHEILGGMSLLWDLPKVVVEHTDTVKTFEVEYEPRLLVRVNHNQDMALMFIQIVQGIRRVTRKMRHSPLQYGTDDAILLNRMKVADELAFAVRASYEAKLLGYVDAWADMCRRFPCVCSAFERHARMDFRDLRNGKAMAAAFESWFLGDYTAIPDKRIVQAMLADHLGYVFGGDEGLRLSVADIAGIGDMAGDKNYLAEHAIKIKDDPVFTEVRRKETANFIWFIKFERSFREMDKVKP